MKSRQEKMVTDFEKKQMSAYGALKREKQMNLKREIEAEKARTMAERSKKQFFTGGKKDAVRSDKIKIKKPKKKD
jgi:hypothetical protein